MGVPNSYCNKIIKDYETNYLPIIDFYFLCFGK